eukprot:Pgem_evm1s16022
MLPKKRLTLGQKDLKKTNHKKSTSTSAISHTQFLNRGESDNNNEPTPTQQPQHHIDEVPLNTDNFRSRKSISSIHGKSQKVNKQPRVMSSPPSTPSDVIMKVLSKSGNRTSIDAKQEPAQSNHNRSHSSHSHFLTTSVSDSPTASISTSPIKSPLGGSTRHFFSDIAPSKSRSSKKDKIKIKNQRKDYSDYNDTGTINKDDGDSINNGFKLSKSTSLGDLPSVTSNGNFNNSFRGKVERSYIQEYDFRYFDTLKKGNHSKVFESTTPVELEFDDTRLSVITDSNYNSSSGNRMPVLLGSQDNLVGAFVCSDDDREVSMVSISTIIHKNNDDDDDDGDDGDDGDDDDIYDNNMVVRDVHKVMNNSNKNKIKDHKTDNDNDEIKRTKGNFSNDGIGEKNDIYKNNE